jgi:SAM-dependent methyltransferase
MEFYSAISRFYDDLFPADARTVRFLADRAGGQDRGAGAAPPVNRAGLPAFGPVAVLDIACGTGEYALALARLGHRATGVDRDAGMIRRARRKARAQGAPVRFLQADMLELGAACPGPFRLAFCIGNSLVHLGGEEEVARFLAGCRTVLEPGGALVIQIINFDRIVEQRIVALPEIRPAGKPIRFVRRYLWAPGDRQVRFATELIAGEGRKEMRLQNSVPLLILGSDRLRSLLEEGGWREVRLYGDFGGGPHTAESFLTVASARR